MKKLSKLVTTCFFSSRKRKALGWLGAVFLALLAWLGAVSVTIWRFGYTDHAKPADCAIILGAAIAGTQPSPVFEERLRHGITLYREGLVPALIVTGGLGEGSHLSEGRVGSDYLISAGIPASDVFREERSLTTLQNLSEAAKVMKREGFASSIVVSDPLHLKRAQMMADDLGLRTVTSPTPTSKYRSLRTRLPFLFRELYFVHHFHFFKQ
ncbi:MAG: YdcF family protein [Verrucomicrobiota bacterium JB023]|nr:YdcF family protein [Verrucomicrobiota bacterium JB023]